ncbi:MAG: M55 family metallopeptidase [Candidatus Bathyarchaeota archaeon]|nr:MAG: M55 family metallopeptidase [Candidatus Bathyarchaeota archaeon]
MKAFISVDLEGLPYVVIPAHLNLKGSLYDEARKIATQVSLIVADELYKNGFDQVVIADSHGPMVNIMVDDLPEYVEIVRGVLRPGSMVSGAESCDIALFLGYHAKYGTAQSTFDHTYSGRTVRKVEINGVEASEFLLNAYTLGEMEIPVVLVAGDAVLLRDDVEHHTPWAEAVALKDSISRIAAHSASMVRLERELKEGVKKAITNFKQNRVTPLLVKKPVKTVIAFHATHQADAAELLTMVSRTGGLTVEYTSGSMIDAYKTLQLLVLASAGTASLLENLK